MKKTDLIVTHIPGMYQTKIIIDLISCILTKQYSSGQLTTVWFGTVNPWSGLDFHHRVCSLDDDSYVSYISSVIECSCPIKLKKERHTKNWTETLQKTANYRNNNTRVNKYRTYKQLHQVGG